MKRKMTTCFATLVVLFFTAGLQFLHASETIEKVLVEKQFDVNKGVNLNVSHEFGKVFCKNWDKPQISVKITAKITARTADKANSLMDRITTKVNGTKSEVNASCKLSSGKNNDQQKIELTMEIMMPEWVNLDLVHSFGSAWIGDVSGNTKIESEYGELVMGSLSGISNRVEMSFGKATIEKVTDAELEVSYGKMNIGQAGNLQVESEFSDVFLSEAKKVSVKLEGGNFEAVKVQSIDGDSEFTNIKIDELSSVINMEMSYGGLSIKELSSNFTLVSLETDFSSVSIHVAPGSSYKLQVNSEFGSIDYPEKQASVTRDIRDVTDRRIEAVVGANSNPNALITINSDYGSIKIY